MPAEPKPIDLKTLSKHGLKNLVENAKRLGNVERAKAALAELARRGGGKASDFDLLEWNQNTVREALQPFADVAKTVPDNKRTPYTEAGGMKIGRSKDDPDWKWVDTYSAIKTQKLNAVFVGYVEKPGDDAYFHLIVDGVIERIYPPSDLVGALDRWRAIAVLATAK
jgi:hypothetical protein